MISKSMVERGYTRGVIKLVPSPHEDGIVCQIEDNWFYFGGLTAESYDDVGRFKEDIPASDIISEIFSVLDEFQHDQYDLDEANYYEAILNENGIYQDGPEEESDFELE